MNIDSANKPATNIAAIIGGGVIGGGWVARFLLHGWRVQVFDQDPDAKSKIESVLDNARSSFPQLMPSISLNEGSLVYCNSISEAVSGAQWIQESVPERLDIKHDVLKEIEAHASTDALIGSSTSGFMPSELRPALQHSDRLFVAHPFNPVYLLPLVELVPGDDANAAYVQQAKQVMAAIGMKPLQVRTEMPAHIADRFLEAVWREALWMIKEGQATTSEIDDAIRYGFGLRWAQMGLFETYRIAGGNAGMAHFIAQFGPCLEWPWTKLMDVPELDDELVEKIANQSDAQSGQYSIKELEQIRDANLIDMLLAQKKRQWAAGELINKHEQWLQAKNGTASSQRSVNAEQDVRLMQTHPNSQG
jgi:carnitine 3-dehydrogenase